MTLDLPERPMTDTPNCGYGSPTSCSRAQRGGGCLCIPETSAAPDGLDFEAAERDAAEYRTPSGLARVVSYRDEYQRILQAQHHTLLAAAVEQARREERESRYGDVIAGYIADIGALKQVIHEADQAMKSVCPDEPEDEGVNYVCCDENGDPQIEADTLGEAITQLSAWFSAFQQTTEKKLWAFEEAAQKNGETLEAYRKVNTQITEQINSFAPLVAAVAEWQEAQKALRSHEPAHADFLGAGSDVAALRVRLDNAITTLSALPLPSVTP